MAKALNSLDLTKPQIMAVLNITPDSFSDGGKFYSDDAIDLGLVIAQAELAIKSGATILDIGGESTRPGAQAVSTEQEIDRVLPVLEVLQDYDAVLSVDTSNAKLMRYAKEYNVGLINDVRALQKEGALEAASIAQLPVCLMHMQGEPDVMQQNPQYQSVDEEVLAFLSARVAACEAVNIDKQKILLDPGFGFGKTLEHNLRLLNQLPKLCALGLPVLVGFSRKSMIEHALGKRAIADRVAASTALAVMALERGARIFRVHDVQQTSDAINMAWHVLQEGNS